ncbi:hypothetical protein [Hyalangium gracile]|uniref:hypothetical protein n=1 Tax=Hyalangium gracile TaxID=394092 RepID=UPI001CCD2914|nr:hypothetical protein [Hyalangium gracile]
MAKRTRIIEGTWDCTSCDTKGILARHKKCPQCGNPRELTGEESEFDFGETDAATGKSLREGVTDEKALELAKAGADWFCAYCGASNRGDQKICKNCRAERTGDAKALREEADPGLPPPRPSPQQAVPKKRGPLAKVGLALLGSLFLCCGGTVAYRIWASIPHDTTGQITGTEWKRSVAQERFTPVTLEGWADQLRAQSPRMPVDGKGEVAGVQNIRNCVPRQRTTRKVADGTERVCSTKTRKVACGTEEKCRTRDKGNGFREEICEDVTKYCSESYEDCRNETRYRTEPVYEPKCSYDTYEWKKVTHQELSGEDGEPPRWPELSVRTEDRLRREEEYIVHLEYDGGKKKTKHELKTEQEYLAWKKGQQVSLTVTNGGEVQKIAPR